MGIVWASSDTDCSTDCFDGIEAVAYHKITNKIISNTTIANPTWETYWVDRTTHLTNTAGAEEFWCFDLIPTQHPDTSVGVLTRDAGAADCLAVDDVSLTDALTKNLCTETWALSSDGTRADGVTCV